MPPEILAIAAPFCIALGGMFSAELTGKLSVAALTRWRVMAPMPLLIAIACLSGGWATVEAWHIPYLLASGIVGMVISDAALSAAIFAIGARLATLVFSLNAPIAALLALYILGEPLSAGKIAGIVLVFAGIALAVAYRPTLPGAVVAPLDRRLLFRGLALGALSAAAQACSVIIARPVMAQAIDATAAMSVRLGAAAVVVLLMGYLLGNGAPERRLEPRFLAYSILGAVIGIGLGVTFVFAALQNSDVATVSTLASMTPVAVLPLIWIRTRVAPRWEAWVGALTAFGGVALISNS